MSSLTRIPMIRQIVVFTKAIWKMVHFTFFNCLYRFFEILYWAGVLNLIYFHYKPQQTHIVGIIPLLPDLHPSYARIKVLVSQKNFQGFIPFIISFVCPFYLTLTFFWHLKAPFHPSFLVFKGPLFLEGTPALILVSSLLRFLSPERFQIETRQ